MNLKSLPNQDRFLGVATGTRQEKTDSGIAEFLLLEECVARCEALAEVISESGVSHPLMADLSECIAACETYLAAKARESRHEDRLGAYCADVLTTTAAACLALECNTSTRCRKTCQVCMKVLGRRRHHPTPLYN